MIGILYILVIILANSVGAVSGMGGGVIIKPVLDFIGFHSIAEISFYSTVAVLTMSVVSTSKQIKNGMSVNWTSAGQLSVGSVLGGVIGTTAFNALLKQFPDGMIVQLTQIILTLLTLLFAYWYSRGEHRRYNYQSGIIKIATGFLLGFLASLLGIGGGPINVALLMLLFNLPIKAATVYSIIIILFSQAAKVITIFLSKKWIGIDMTMLWYIIPAAIVGGYLGALISKKVSNQRVNQIYQVVILLVMALNIYNAWRLF